MKRFSEIVFWLLAFLFIANSLRIWQIESEVGFAGFISIMLALSAVLRLTLLLLRRVKIISNKTYTNTGLLFVSLVSAISLGEICLRTFSKEYQCYYERTGVNYYGSLYGHFELRDCDSCHGGPYFICDPNTTDAFIRKEFRYPHHYNSLGLRDKEFVTAKQPGEFRILGLGDSFTEGVGTPADSTWLKQLEYKLNDSLPSVHFTTLNGGVHGSDLFFAYQLFTNCLMKYKPDVVILDLNSTDINDIIWRGNYDRFDANGKFVGKKGVWWEYFFGSSFIVRAIVLNVLHYNWGLQTADEQRETEANTMISIAQKINDFQKLADKEHFKFLLVLQPLKEDLQNADVYANLQISTAVQKINLYPYFKDKIVTQKQPEDKYYWPEDGHFKSFGYGLMATEISKQFFISPIRESIVLKP